MELLALATAPLLGIMYIVISTFARAVPLMMIAAPILYENPSRMMGSFQRIHIPKTILVMICILLRFFPVIQKEMVSIFNGVRARGIFLIGKVSSGIRLWHMNVFLYHLQSDV